MHAPSDGRGEPDAKVGTKDVIIHRLGNVDDGKALTVKVGRFQVELTGEENEELLVKVFSALKTVS